MFINKAISGERSERKFERNSNLKKSNKKSGPETKVVMINYCSARSDNNTKSLILAQN